jgi:1-acyl-sn-glycerol-3-phosphate acyltransferase
VTLLRQLFYPIGLFFITMWYAVTVILAAILRVPYRHWGVYDQATRGWARKLLWISGCPVTVRGGEHLSVDEPHIIASNHASFFDICAIAGYLPVPVKFVAKKELFPIPFFGWALTALRAVKLDRGNLKQAFGAYEEAARFIKQERLHVLIFPEGTRTRTGELQPFKKGPFVLAISCQAKIVPVYVGGTFGILPKGSIRIRPHPIVLAIGEPIPSDGLTYDERDVLGSRAESAVRAMRAEAEGTFATR